MRVSQKVGQGATKLTFIDWLDFVSIRTDASGILLRLAVMTTVPAMLCIIIIAATTAIAIAAGIRVR